MVKLTKIIENIEVKNSLLEENTKLRSKLSERLSFENIITQNKQMQKVMSTAARVANTNVPVLIFGESGTDKELIARAIHYSSQRADKPFVMVNCAALSESLFESEFFGFEKGVFTGAEKHSVGRFEETNYATLFITEVGDILLSIQVKLLRAIQFGEIQRIGSKRTVQDDVRVITATNKKIQQMVKEGKFHEDLYYRFNVISLNLPPLWHKKEEIVLLNYFLELYSD